MPTATPGPSSSGPDLLIIGAGIAGVAVAWAAEAAGLTYRIVDAGKPAGSWAALALLREAWAPGPTGRRMTRYALGEYARRGLLAHSGAIWRNGSAEKYAPDWHAVDPAAVLGTVAAERAEVDAVLPYRATTRTSALEARRAVVWCGGAEIVAGIMDPIGRRNWGATAALPPAGRPGLTIAHLRPYHAVGLISGPTRRFGSSTAGDPVAAEAALRADAAKARIDITGAEVVAARRAFAPVNLLRIADGLWWLGGLGRLGYALAPALGAELVERINAAPPVSAR